MDSAKRGRDHFKHVGADPLIGNRGAFRAPGRRVNGETRLAQGGHFLGPLNGRKLLRRLKMLVTMASHHTYRIDIDGDVVTGFYVHGANDAASYIEALRLADGCAEVEVWSGFHWVATFAPHNQRLHLAKRLR